MGEGQTTILCVDLLSISIFSPSLFQFIFFFQIPRLPELLLRLQDYQFLEDLFTGQHSVTTNSYSAIYNITLLPYSSPSQGVKNKASFPPDIVEAYKYTFSKPGALSGPINYYRCMFSSQKDHLPRDKWTINVPTLIIWVIILHFIKLSALDVNIQCCFCGQGDDDHVLQKEMADSHENICTNLTVKLVES